MVFAVTVFGCSFVGIAALFALKHWELRHNKIVAPALRARLDVRAHQVKELIFAARADAARLAPEMVRMAHALVHEGALAFARLARTLERQAHRLADTVSHKRGFERRETRSEFLKKVAEHKQSNLEEGSDSVENS